MAGQKQATPQVKEKPPEAAAAPAEDRKVEQLSPTRMTEAEYRRTVYVATAHANTNPEDLLAREYWSHVAEKLKPWDHIEVRANDGGFYGGWVTSSVVGPFKGGPGSLGW